MDSKEISRKQVSLRTLVYNDQEAGQENRRSALCGLDHLEEELGYGPRDNQDGIANTTP